MSQLEEGAEGKRPVEQEETPDNGEPPKKILKSDLNLPFKKKNFALLLAYCGKDYYGLQINKGYKTIEGVLFEAMVKSGVVRQDHVENNGMRFQRAARTDKGVSAAANVVNAKISLPII
ncbi:DgyrCDS5487 [Dimorphilus gyrociliatus]|uniref:DgyrCDS5487 n=1 Tax=Dimorphilus gyrociliatus TaxID=2664684 RepID=A0A7I8VKQ0_9ANNE|nr:DgyrCDS5487 [Dimorphilus gyrociliatus]